MSVEDVHGIIYTIPCTTCGASAGMKCWDMGDGSVKSIPHAMRAADALGLTDLRLEDEDLRRAEIREEDLLVPFDLESLVPPRSDVSVSPTAMIAYGKGKYTWVLLGVRGVGWFTTGQTSWSGGGTGKALNWHMVLDLIEDADWVFEVVRGAPIADLAEWHEELGDGFD